MLQRILFSLTYNMLVYTPRGKNIHSILLTLILAVWLVSSNMIDVNYAHDENRGLKLSCKVGLAPLNISELR